MSTKIGRNDPCWCGSGKKYKKCHEAFDAKVEILRQKGYPVLDHKLIKTPEQIEKIKESCRINVAVLDYVAEHIKAGVSTEEIDHWVHEETVRHGGIPAPLNYEGFPKSVCTSVNEVVCHGIPSEDEILKDGDIVNVDVSTIYNGYFSDSSRMFCIGNVSPEKEKLVRVTKECVEIGISKVKPWEPIGNMGHAVHMHALENGYTIVMKDEYNEDSFTDALELDKWKYSYEIYTYDGKEYGVLEMTVTSNGVTRHYFTVVKFIDFEDYGKIAIPIEGWEELDALPEGFVRKTSDPYNLYGYTIMQQTLNINRDNSNSGTTEPGTTEPGGNNSGVNNPGTNNSDANNPGTNNSGANNSGTNNASTIKPGAENNLVPGKAKAPAVKKAKKKSVKLVWRKIKNAKKYQVQYSLNKKFKKGKKYGTKTLTTANIKITIKKLNKKTYYVRIRGINGKNIGKWSKVKKITMKK